MRGWPLSGRSESPRTRRRFRDRMTYGNVVSTLAVFLALTTGTAYATHLVVRSSDVVNDTLLSQDLKDGFAVKGDDVVDDTLTGAKIKESTLGQVPRAVIGGLGRSAYGAECNPESTTFGSCVAVEITLTKPARVLMIARTTAVSEDGTKYAAGYCQLGTSAGVLTETAVPIDLDQNFGTREHVAITGIRDTLPAGVYGFGLDCQQETFSTTPGHAGIKYENSSITAVAISPS